MIRPMLKDHKLLIYTGAALATGAIANSVLPSDGGICLDRRTMCAPLPAQLDDEPAPSNDPLQQQRSLVVAAASVSSVSIGQMFYTFRT